MNSSPHLLHCSIKHFEAYGSYVSILMEFPTLSPLVDGFFEPDVLLALVAYEIVIGWVNSLYRVEKNEIIIGFGTTRRPSLAIYTNYILNWKKQHRND